MFFLLSLSLLSTLVFSNSLYFVFVLLFNVLAILYLLVSTSSLSVLTMLMLIIVYLGAMMILIGYICAVCPNINLSSTKSFSPILSLSLLSTLVLSYLTLPSPSISSVSLVSEFLYCGSGLIVLSVLVFMLFVTLLMVTSQYSTPSGPFRSVT